MPRIPAIVVLIGSAFVLVGCSQTTSPTSPTSVPSSIGASSTCVAARLLSLPHSTRCPSRVTFHGSDTVTPPTITTRATGTGTHLGRFSFAHVITFPALTGSSQWVAANGDSLETTSVVVSSVSVLLSVPIRRITPLLVGRVDSRVRRGASRWSAHTFWHPVTMERMSLPDRSRGPSLPQARPTETASLA